MNVILFMFHNCCLFVVITLLKSFRDEPARHFLSQSGSKSHQAEASKTMDEQTNCDEVMHNKQADQTRIVVCLHNTGQQYQKSGR